MYFYSTNWLNTFVSIQRIVLCSFIHPPLDIVISHGSCKYRDMRRFYVSQSGFNRLKTWIMVFLTWNKIVQYLVKIVSGVSWILWVIFKKRRKKVVVVYWNGRVLLTGMQARVLLDVAELLEASVAVGAFVRLLAGVHSDVLHQLVVWGEGLEALLTLVRLHLAAMDRFPGVHLHGRLVHEDLWEERSGRRPVSEMWIHGANSGAVLTL